MSTDPEELWRRMEAAAAAMELEEASRLRDKISLLRERPDSISNEDIDTSRLTRQRPGGHQGHRRNAVGSDVTRLADALEVLARRSGGSDGGTG